MIRPLFIVLFVAGFSGCATAPQSQAPISAKTVGPVFAEYAVEKVDKDGDHVITRREWLAAGGSEKSFKAIDADRNSVLSVTEIKEASSTDKFFAFAKRTIDTGGNTELTPQSFRSPAGAKLFSYEF